MSSKRFINYIYFIMIFVGLIVFFIYMGTVISKNAPVVEIKNGFISGKTFISLQNNTLYAYLEIPYAQPPVGNLRFKEPQPAKNWTGILNTTANTKFCWEARFDQKVDDPRQNEDCLYLNVFSPVPPGTKSSLPVYVYLYGGRFLFGHASHDYIDPQMLVDTGIVAVTLNYRSGPLGFLTTEDGVIPANLGLKDQNLALRWVQDNIRFFGGDPSKVVLSGQSSGAACVSHHLRSPKAAGLFRGAIIQSGSGISNFGTIKRAKFLATQLGKQLSNNFSEKNSSQELLDLLMKLPAKTITYVQFYNIRIEYNILEKYFFQIAWRPTIERADLPNAYITKLPYDSRFVGDFNRVPLLTGVMSEESLFYLKYIPLWAESMDTTTIFFETNNIRWGFRKLLEEKVKKIYTNGTFKDNPIAFTKYLSDYLISNAVVREAHLHYKFADTYLYRFSYYGKMNALVTPEHTKAVEGLGNAGHGEELPYLILYPEKAENMHRYPKSDRYMQSRMVKLWSNFVKYLNPTPVADPLADSKIWPKLSEDNFSYIDIDTNISVVKGFPGSYEKWIPLFDDYYEYPLAIL